MRLEGLVIPLTFDENGLDMSMRSVKQTLVKFGADTAALGAITGIGSAYVAFMASTIEPAAEAETANMRLATALQASGRNAEISAPQLGELATKLAGLSTFGDEEIIAGFQAMTTFSQVPTSAFEAVGQMAMDMAAFGEAGGSVPANVEAIGRVLETGIIPRTWAFTDAQKEQFKALYESGTNADRLQYLLEILNGKYGGQAAAELQTYNGQVKDLKDKWSEFKENIGSQYLPALEGLLGWVNKNFEGIKFWAEAIGTIINPLGALGEKIAEIIRSLADFDWNSLPEWLYSSGGNGPGFYPGKRAGGGGASGLTWVGERGPELVNLPRGSHVYSAQQSQSMTPGFDYYMFAQILSTELQKVLA